jgi:hypothetical protein
MRRAVWQSALLASVFLGVGGALASVQVRKTVCSLGLGEWSLCAKDGHVCLVKVARDKAPRWHVTAPTIKDEKGRFLACDPAGKPPTLHLVNDRTPHTQWAFEITARIGPEEVEAGKGVSMKRGDAGFRFKLRMEQGPFKGWYLAAGDVPEGQEKRGGREPTRPLQLVRDARDAAEFTYVRERFDIR